MPFKTSSFRGNSFQYMSLPEEGATDLTYSDEASVRDTLWNVQPGDSVFDVGAGFGSYTLTSLAVEVAQVHCWAITPGQMDVLTQSAEANGWADKCFTHNFGLYSSQGYYNWQVRAFSPIEGANCFPVVTLDSMNIPTPTSGNSWLKIDTEGAELEILKGAVEFLNKVKPNVMVENHEFLVAGITADTRAYLESLGYVHQTTNPYNAISHSLFTMP